MDFSQSHDIFFPDPPEEKYHLPSQLSDEAVCRTALATPGLLKTYVLKKYELLTPPPPSHLGMYITF